MNTSLLPLPLVTPENRHFWQGGKEGVLNFLYCVHCRYLIHPPGPICPQCLRGDVDIGRVSGRARIETFTINHQAWLPALGVPYALAIVSIVEQPDVRLTTQIVNADFAAICIGMAVRVTFVQHGDVWLPLFEPDAGGGDGNDI